MKVHKIIGVASALLIVASLSACQTAGITAADDPNRVALNSFDVETSNPSTFNDWKSSPLTVEGVMSYPEGEGPFPAVVYLLSSGGYQKPYDDKWIGFLNDAGYATIMVNQYTARGMSLTKGLGSKQSGMSDMSYLSDVFAAIREIRTNPRIDPNRIATFGMSWGGGIQAYLMSRWYSETVGDGIEIQAHVALSPACYWTVENPAPTSGHMLMLLGENDNWNEPEPCKDYAAKLNGAGGQVTVIDVADGQHAFDKTKKLYTHTATTYHCQITWSPETMVGYNHREGKELDLRTEDWLGLWKDCSKPTRVTTGGTQEQRQFTEEKVLEHLSANL